MESSCLPSPLLESEGPPGPAALKAWAAIGGIAFRAIEEAAKKAAVLLYSPEADPFFEELVKNADRAFYFEQGSRIVSRVHPRTQRSQRTLQAFS